MIDQWGRNIDYLRISVTDRCNLRCKYCMPRQNVCFMPEEDLLTINEISRVARLSAELGITKVRITGGEPLVREGIVDLVRNIKSYKGIKEVCITTNGILLGDYLDELIEAGLDRVNISLDTLNSKTFKEITGGGDLDTVLQAIDMCLQRGIKVKLNTVIMKEYNFNEIYDFIELTRKKPLDIRFIEMMPIGAGRMFKSITTTQIMDRILEKNFLIPCKNDCKEDGPANYYRLEGSLGRIGFISPMSHSYCKSCNRIRLTAEGFFKQCLNWKKGKNIETLMRQGISDENLLNELKQCIYSKPYEHGFRENSLSSDKRFMFQIGG